MKLNPVISRCAQKAEDAVNSHIDRNDHCKQETNIRWTK